MVAIYQIMQQTSVSCFSAIPWGICASAPLWILVPIGQWKPIDDGGWRGKKKRFDPQIQEGRRNQMSFYFQWVSPGGREGERERQADQTDRQGGNWTDGLEKEIFLLFLQRNWKGRPLSICLGRAQMVPLHVKLSFFPSPLSTFWSNMKERASSIDPKESSWSIYSIDTVESLFLRDS